MDPTKRVYLPFYTPAPQTSDVSAANPGNSGVLQGREVALTPNNEQIVQRCAECGQVHLSAQTPPK